VWEIEFTDQFEQWWSGLDLAQQAAIAGRAELLGEQGPDLGRPAVDSITASRHNNMKELRASKSGVLRVLFAFDPRRHAILLLGGDKSGQWNAWYRMAIPVAGDLYDNYLKELHEEGLIE